MDAEDLRGPPERLGERDRAGRRILPEAAVEDRKLLLRLELIRLRDDRRGREHLEDLADEEVLVLVEEALHPGLVVEAALDLDHPLGPVVLEEALLLLVGLAQERERGAHAPRPVVLVHPQIKLVEAAVGVDAQRVLLEDDRVLADRGLGLIGRLVELGQDLPLDGLVAA